MKSKDSIICSGRYKRFLLSSYGTTAVDHLAPQESTNMGREIYNTWICGRSDRSGSTNMGTEIYRIGIRGRSDRSGAGVQLNGSPSYTAICFLDFAFPQARRRTEGRTEPTTQVALRREHFDAEDGKKGLRRNRRRGVGKSNEPTNQRTNEQCPALRHCRLLPCHPPATPSRPAPARPAASGADCGRTCAPATVHGACQRRMPASCLGRGFSRRVSDQSPGCLQAVVDWRGGGMVMLPTCKRGWRWSRLCFDGVERGRSCCISRSW